MKRKSIRMSYEEAITVTGAQPSFALRSMVRALELHPWLNTREDNRRLVAARTVLKYRTRQRGKGVLDHA